MAFQWGTGHGLSACSGAEVHIYGDETFAIRVVELSLLKSSLHIDRKKEHTIRLDQLADIKITVPMALTLTGKGVLIKKTALLENITEQSLRQLFPAFKPSEFYVQHFNSGDQTYITFIRKEIADPVLAAFRKLGITILVFSLGPFIADQVIPLLNIYGNILEFDGHQVVLTEDKTWQQYTYIAGQQNEFELKIDIEPIPQQFVLAYAAAFQLILNERLELICVADEHIEQDLTELLARLKFRKKGTILLFSIFALLLINFLVFSYYNSANQALAGKAGQRSDQSLDRQKLEQDVKEKETQVNLLGWNHGQRYAFLCDQIGQTVPAAITLHELNINSGKEKSSSVPRELTETGSIRIIGQSASVYVINDWIYALKQKPWVKMVQLEKYGRDEQKDTQIFTLIVNY
jgi:hypothetical protein